MQNHLNIDLDLFQQPKVQKLESELGKEAVGFYIELLLMLAKAKDFMLIKDYKTISYSTKLKPKFIQSVIEDFDLFIFGNFNLLDSNGFHLKSVPYFWCEDVVKKMLEINTNTF